MKIAGRRRGPIKAPVYKNDRIRERRGTLREYGPLGFCGVMLVLSFAFAGHYMGQNAVAHNAMPGEELAPLLAPSSNIVAKGSLLPEGTGLEIINMTSAGRAALAQSVLSNGKGDMPAVSSGSGKGGMIPSDVQIVPAAVDLTEPDEPSRLKLALTPPKSKIEQSFKLKRSEKDKAEKATRSEKQKVVAQRRVKLAEENCLARAVYFEARSESELGQLAVAKVILNRVKDPEYPNTICGVVYQGSGRRNSCQFSFACDGLPDDVKNPAAWSRSKQVAQKALAGDSKVAAIGSATNYHADYVKPKWAKSMKRLIKIGRHIFYTDS